jgi:hypothetical protein
MATATLILVVSGAISALLVLYALVIALRQRPTKSTDLSALWPPRYFLGELHRPPPSSPRTSVAQPEARPTAAFERPTTPTNVIPAAEQPTRLDNIEATSLIRSEELQPPFDEDSPLDRTSQVRHSLPPTEPE